MVLFYLKRCIHTHLTKTQDPKLPRLSDHNQNSDLPTNSTQWIRVVYRCDFPRAFRPPLFPQYPQSTGAPGQPPAGQEPTRCPQLGARQGRKGQAGRRSHGAVPDAAQAPWQRSGPHRSAAGAGTHRRGTAGTAGGPKLPRAAATPDPLHPSSLPPPAPGKARGGARPQRAEPALPEAGTGTGTGAAEPPAEPPPTPRTTAAAHGARAPPRSPPPRGCREEGGPCGRPGRMPGAVVPQSPLGGRGGARGRCPGEAALSGGIAPCPPGCPSGPGEPAWHRGACLWVPRKPCTHEYPGLRESPMASPGSGHCHPRGAVRPRGGGAPGKETKAAQPERPALRREQPGRGRRRGSPLLRAPGSASGASGGAGGARGWSVPPCLLAAAASAAPRWEGECRIRQTVSSGELEWNGDKAFSAASWRDPGLSLYPLSGVCQTAENGNLRRSSLDWGFIIKILCFAELLRVNAIWKSKVA